MLSSNEKLQSMNEELQTAKEELQSTNEELTTLNDELHNRYAELSQPSSDLNNVLGSMNVPVLILSRDLRIRRKAAACAPAPACGRNRRNAWLAERTAGPGEIGRAPG